MTENVVWPASAFQLHASLSAKYAHVITILVQASDEDYIQLQILADDLDSKVVLLHSLLDYGLPSAWVTTIAKQCSAAIHRLRQAAAAIDQR
jgi:hypothetical protein